ncbi:S26 family signal peptidase [Treponema sp. TIM-1]|uniref:S26 family signal peptidase n=1 Tax=Treponema sp. TIM-1 TaxID=2898417 RepID=UPI0039806096
MDLRANSKKAILGAFFVAIMMKLFCFDFVIAEGQSMAPVITSGSVLLVSRLSYGLRLPLTNRYLFRWGRPRVGDVVIFFTPQGEIAVKRCARITEKNEFVALGDNSVDSYDSRAYGPVPLYHIIGKVLGK